MEGNNLNFYLKDRLILAKKSASSILNQFHLFLEHTDISSFYNCVKSYIFTPKLDMQIELLTQKCRRNPEVAKKTRPIDRILAF